MTKQKYEREIDEILARLERQGKPPQPRRRRVGWTWPRGMRMPATFAVRWDNRTWLALVIGLPLLGALISSVLPSLAALLVLAGVLIFIAPLVLNSARRPRDELGRRWRGKIVDMPYQGGGLAARWRYIVWVWRQRWERWRNRQ